MSKTLYLCLEKHILPNNKNIMMSYAAVVKHRQSSGAHVMFSEVFSNFIDLAYFVLCLLTIQ